MSKNGPILPQLGSDIHSFLINFSTLDDEYNEGKERTG